ERGNLLLKAVKGRASMLEEAEGYAREALEIFRTHDNERREGAALVELSQFAYLRGDRTRSDDLVNEAIELLERHPPGEELLDGYARRAGMLTVSGRAHEALPAVEQTIALADELGIDAISARMIQYRGIARTDLGDFDGVEDIRNGMALSRKIGDIATFGVGFSNLGTQLLLESPESALKVWDEGTDF